MTQLEQILAEYDLAVDRTPEGKLRVWHQGCSQAILEGDMESCSLLVAVLVSERLRIAAELSADAATGQLQDVESFEADLEELLDSNAYILGARSDGRYEDEEFGWSRTRAARHAKFLLSFGVIGKGVEKVDAEDPVRSGAFKGFLGGVQSAVRKWLDEGHLMQFAPSAPSLR
jgi:hypothetical protein